jgi:beta-lactamase class A
VRDAADRFDGISAVWIHELATGRAASFNAGALFPAASMVKLGVLVEAVRRMGSRPDQSAMAHDASAIGAWSSNLGANRLLGRVGGSSGVQVALRRMGAASSTYTGPYIVATGRPPVDAPRQPPRVSGRVTSASDIGAVLLAIHQAAVGDADALTATRMTRVQARALLGMLLASEPAGDNLGLFTETLGPDTLAAQKHGWISSARHSAALIYGPSGPVIVVALTYRPGVSRRAAAQLGAELVRIATG